MINALIILSIGAIIYESFLENKIETTQAAAEQAYRTMIRSNLEMERAIRFQPFFAPFLIHFQASNFRGFHIIFYENRLCETIEKTYLG